MTDVAIVGLGPWGLAVFERLVAAFHATPPSATIRVHVVEPGVPGVGAFGIDQPDYLILNTPCGWHSVSPRFDEATSDHQSFYEWIQARNYRRDGDRCRVGEGTPIAPSDFVPRRLMGEYLASCYSRLVAASGPHIEVIHHKTMAVDVVQTAGGRERVILADDKVVEVDHVVLTTGHTECELTGEPRRVVALRAYPATKFADDGTVPPGSSVAIRGLGLVALDVLMALTVGRGGRFIEVDGDLRYEASGLEPKISMFSRHGYPYCAKSSPGTLDPSAREYAPSIFTDGAVSTLRHAARDGRLDARAHLLPLLFAEMQLRYYEHCALGAHGLEGAARVRNELVDGWIRGTFAQALLASEAEYGRFDPEGHLFVGTGDAYRSSADYQTKVRDVIARDLEEALLPTGASALKAAYAVPRIVRDTLRRAVEFGGLTAESHFDFQSNIRPRLARLIAGPPTNRVRELLALIESGVVRLPFGPGPAVEAIDGGVLVSSRHLQTPHSDRVDYLVHGILREPQLSDSTSPLLVGLRNSGRLRELRIGDVPVGSVDLSADFHPVDTRGQVNERLSIFGPLTEGVRYYTGYLPSPKDQRASADARRCVERILRVASPAGGEIERPSHLVEFLQV